MASKKRKRIKLDDKKSNQYFTSEKEGLDFVSTGCQMVDNILGGGYVLGRVTNIIGDKSTAKTALAMEALINFLNVYEDGAAAYREAESAFDYGYAEAMGLPIDIVDFGDEDNQIETVEDLYKDINEFLDKRIETGTPGIYILDSLDGLTDEASMKRGITEGSYDMTKQKFLSKFFRENIRKIERANTLVIFISQVRDNIGAMFGEKHRRAGGKALDFYASQFLWLHHKGYINKTIKGIKRAIGVTIIAKCKKNKVGFPFRQCEFDFLFGFGVDDIGANLKWLKEIKRLKEVDLTEKELKPYLADLEDMDDDEYQAERDDVADITRDVWNETEITFLPTRKKYRS